MDVAVNLAQVAAALIAASTLFWGVWSYTKSSRLEHYTELDRLYFDIVALRMAHPHLGDPDLIRRLNLEQRTERALRYDSYALLIWNFIETIFDRCKQRDLLETWKPILDHEGELHCEWFARNLNKFKLSFRKWASQAMPEVGKLVGPEGELLHPLPPPALPQRPAIEALQYHAAAIDLGNRIHEAIVTWEVEGIAGVDIERNWRIAEALHLATWHRPLCHAPLCLLLDEERLGITNMP